MNRVIYLIALVFIFRGAKIQNKKWVCKFFELNSSNLTFQAGSFGSKYGRLKGRANGRVKQTTLPCRILCIYAGFRAKREAGRFFYFLSSSTMRAIWLGMRICWGHLARHSSQSAQLRAHVSTLGRALRRPSANCCFLVV